MQTPHDPDPAAPSSSPPIPTWHEQRIPPCPRCSLFHDPRDHDGGHEHAHPSLFEACICGEPYPRTTIAWPWADGVMLEVATVKALATGNHEPETRHFRLASRCHARGLPGTRAQRRGDRRHR